MYRSRKQMDFPPQKTKTRMHSAYTLACTRRQLSFRGDCRGRAPKVRVRRRPRQFPLSLLAGSSASVCHYTFCIMNSPESWVAIISTPILWAWGCRHPCCHLVLLRCWPDAEKSFSVSSVKTLWLQRLTSLPRLPPYPGGFRSLNGNSQNVDFPLGY